MSVIKDFVERCFLDKRSNATYISLISKKEGTEQLSVFHPINLVASTYNIISKCLAVQLFEVLLRIMSKEQGAFLK